jgi:hypothetical protein
VLPLQTYGSHLMVVAGWQVPMPSQVRPEVRMTLFVGQEGGAHEVPPAYSRQAPLPSQNPSVPQLAFPMSWQVPCGSVVPSGTLVQVPSALASPQDWQAPWQGLAQQTPCAQKPDRHSTAVAHDCPFPLRPHDPLMQTAGDPQSPSVVHEFLQMPTPHWYGKQGVGLGVRQWPAPSQLEAAVKVVEPVGQVEAWQVVPDR